MVIGIQTREMTHDHNYWGESMRLLISILKKSRADVNI